MRECPETYKCVLHPPKNDLLLFIVRKFEHLILHPKPSKTTNRTAKGPFKAGAWPWSGRP